MQILNQHEPSSIFRQKEFDFQSLGVGTDESFKEMFLGMIASRMYHPRVARKYGVKHVKGFLIHGPSGTGKTLLARTLGVILKNTKVRICLQLILFVKADSFCAHSVYCDYTTANVSFANYTLKHTMRKLKKKEKKKVYIA
ncbi:unnamed protein product [Coffea canephora]|uniref:Vesicle-fusing ATPase n=1 Tax=Coffea canephora TaxID=49390 RepID=A0A068V5X7_COFCA|nr:unnamed protein product [Coffea canephora]